jgi:hypothetical protein
MPGDLDCVLELDAIGRDVGLHGPWTRLAAAQEYAALRARFSFGQRSFVLVYWLGWQGGAHIEIVATRWL